MDQAARFNLFIVPFLQELKKELGYPIDIGKLKDIVGWAKTEDWEAREDIRLSRLYGVCKLMFLQDEAHELPFSRIFWQYIQDTLSWWKALEGVEAGHSKEVEKGPKADIAPISGGHETPDGGLGETPDLGDSWEQGAMEEEPADEAAYSQRVKKAGYLNLYVEPEAGKEEKFVGAYSSERFLMTDAYLPVSYREMIQSWRYLRKKDEFQSSDRLDIPATVERIAKNGLLDAPVYERYQLNSEDLLVIFADRRGSMVPFHYLTDQLIAAAKSEGGHRKAQVYYFYNYPSGYVYRNPNLTGPISLEEVYGKMRHDRTNALIFSDAGAARGNYNQERAKRTLEFLDGKAGDTGAGGHDALHKRALFVAWLNPMPWHRWAGTTAEAIVRSGSTKMYPLIEIGKEGLLLAVQALMGRNG